ncbi:MAG: hypothetical protein J3R72DRAFT_501221 [Linnemannia gamsii]|nr:MAG: hypothetical protein J3R72DRAFT_501221 [Linnemannia gamsii]
MNKAIRRWQLRITGTLEIILYNILDGAQFRFMFAKEKWSLKAVKWWGGWTEGEGTGTIMRYLLEECTRYEYGFSDMMSPTRQDSRHAVFMGETDTPGTAPLTQYSLDVSL